MFISLKAGLKSLFVFAAILGCSAVASSVACAQDDPNAQYILIQSGKLAGEVREIEVTVEVGVWKLHFNLQSTGDVNCTIITPSNRPLAQNMPNLAITDTREGATEKRSVQLWTRGPASGRFA